ncbi:MAG TPA: carbonic anhydrase family protein [Candidatus Binatia bacterium]
MFRILRNVAAVISAALLLPTGTVFPAEGAHWSYSGHTGPAQWGSMEEDFKTCAAGKLQSPIDIRNDTAKKTDLPALRFDYKPSVLKIVDNGHTIQVNYDHGSVLTAGDKQYELLQFHFHKPSEEKLNGKSYPMVTHLVHRAKDGKLGVVAVLLSNGHGNPLIETLWDHLPKKKETETVVDAVKINAVDLVPKNQAYYTFAGSLTTPPCSEGVTWFVLKDSTSVSREQVARFGKLYPMNARPVQPLNGREVKVSH